jgi:hypothetical protein
MCSFFILWGASMSRDPRRFEDKDASWETVPNGRGQTPVGDRPNRVEGGVPDDDIIELVDVVREGEPPEAPEASMAQPTVDDETLPEMEEDFLAGQDEDLKDFALPLDGMGEEGLEPGLTERDAFDDRPDSPDFDFEGPEDLEELAIEETVSEVAEDDLDLAMAGLGDELEDETAGPVIGEETALASISQERLEAAVSRTVTEVVERVVRETVADVAERVIKEAIDSLKQSLDTRSK